jgi:HAD superfamily hydrolase (TIGR01490 family)
MNLALFDFDGTITRSDTWTPFVRLAATRPRIVAAMVLLAPLIVAYKLRWIPARKARPIVARFAFQGRRLDEIRESGRRYAADVLPGVVRQRALDRLAWHKSRGDTIVVVSASLDVYLAPWCEAMGVDLICTTLEERGPRFTGRYVRGECVGAEKLRRIRQRFDLERYPIVYAYGDTDEDREMLELADEKYYRWQRVYDCSSLTSEHPRPAHTS